MLNYINKLIVQGMTVNHEAVGGARPSWTLRLLFPNETVYWVIIQLYLDKQLCKSH